MFPRKAYVQQGATASVSASFDEIGALAARMTLLALKGSLNTDRVYPEKIHFAVNLTAASACHLQISKDLQDQAERVIP